MNIIETLRGPRVLGMAIFDWVGSLLGAWLVGCWRGVQGPAAWGVFLLAWVLLGVVVHYIVGVDSAFGRMLGVRV